MDKQTPTIKEKAAAKPLTKPQTDKKNRQQPRCRIRQLLRSMLPMEDEARQKEEERSPFR